jgi:hypothetical protein
MKRTFKSFDLLSLENDFKRFRSDDGLSGEDQINDRLCCLTLIKNDTDIKEEKLNAVVDMFAAPKQVDSMISTDPFEKKDFSKDDKHLDYSIFLIL